MGNNIQKVQKLGESESVNYEEIQNLIATHPPTSIFKDFEVYKIMKDNILCTYYIKTNKNEVD